MRAQFWPCSGCSRHIKRGDATCPFCGATAAVEIGPTRTIAGRLSRAALFAAGAVGVGIATTDCAPSLVSEYGCPVPNCAFETEDSSASDGPSEAAPDAGDTSTMPPPDSATTAEDATSAMDGSSDASDASAAGPTDSPSTADVPMLFEAAYGSPMI